MFSEAFGAGGVAPVVFVTQLPDVLWLATPEPLLSPMSPHPVSPDPVVHECCPELELLPPPEPKAAAKAVWIFDSWDFWYEQVWFLNLFKLLIQLLFLIFRKLWRNIQAHRCRFAWSRDL